MMEQISNHFLFVRCHHFFCGGIRQDPMERLVRARHRSHHSCAGGFAAPHGHHTQHLGLLRSLRGLQGLLPIPGANCHVSAKQKEPLDPAAYRHRSKVLPCVHSFQIASSLTRELCGLMFGINTFLGTILKTIISLIVSDKRGIGLDVRDQVRSMLRGNYYGDK